jgi:lauroyl/myristoyl acyltransferase
MASSPSDAVSSPLYPPHLSHRRKDRDTRYTTDPIHAPYRQTRLWQQIVTIVMIRDTAHFQALSDAAARQFGVRLGNPGYLAAGRQWRRAPANLNRAYREELTSAPRTALTRRIFQHFGRAIVDFLLAPTRSTADLGRLVSNQWLWLHNHWKSAFDETQRHLRWNDETGFYTARERWKTGAR